ncbi:CPBP family intramembrane glutamic endopeptidase [Cesiribacter sp. SM1]|uniref:CPBP family intramembrane glutamic endopeptidase n=1 Tax=Cesiribacter sp. SM1 TaxID=2861196 RepID=UPI001CD310E1|nr:CPBP family intramembrane glutamic endopeptidase [Cesiribacter sp. SM1]
MKLHVKIGLVLFLAGFTGILSLLSMPFASVAFPQEVLAAYSETTLRLLSTINPLILLIAAVVVGTILYPKVPALSAPSLEKMLSPAPASWQKVLTQQFKSGLVGGVVAGAAIIVVEAFFKQLLPMEFSELSARNSPNLVVRLLYGGITEEVMLRFGMMTLLAWVLIKLTHKASPIALWPAIVLASLLFAAAHLPLAFALVPEASSLLILYILLGNSVAGIIYGWLYWKKGLEAAIIAHMVTHLIIIGASALV